MTWLRNAWAWFRLQLPLKWWFSGFTAALGAFAGLLGSVWAEQIKAAFPFVWPTGEIVWPAVIFWFSLLLFGLLFGLGFNAQNEATNKLERVIRTLPPRGFLIGFEGLFTAAFGVDSAAHATANRETLEKAINTTLAAVALMVRQFDSRFDRPAYSANIMLFKPVSLFTGEQLNEALFIEKPANPGAWDGVLHLQPEFALTLKDDGTPEPDKKVGGIILPIPKEKYRTENGRSTILPGAPAVFCDPHKYAGFENTLQLADWCREHSGLRPAIAEEIERHFVDGAGKNIRSFLSIPIVAAGAKPAVLGVLNVHSDREGLLPGERAALLVPLTAPFMLLIARSLQKYLALTKPA